MLFFLYTNDWLLLYAYFEIRGSSLGRLLLTHLTYHHLYQSYVFLLLRLILRLYYWLELRYLIHFDAFLHTDPLLSTILNGQSAIFGFGRFYPKVNLRLGLVMMTMITTLSKARIIFIFNFCNDWITLALWGRDLVGFFGRRTGRGTGWVYPQILIYLMHLL